MRRARYRLVCALGALALLNPAQAQRYLLRDGRIIDARGTLIRNGQIVREGAPSGGAGAVGHPLDMVVRLDWPEPVELREARARLMSGDPAEAWSRAEAVARQFAPLAKVPGSWWAEAAWLRARALHALGRSVEAERAARELMRVAADPGNAALARLLVAEIVLADGKTEAASTLLEPLLQTPQPAIVEAVAWVLRGDLALKRGRADAALEAYLQVPAFFPGREDLMPRVLLGSARAYRAFGDKPRSARAYLELKDRFPRSTEAAAARAEAG